VSGKGPYSSIVAHENVTMGKYTVERAIAELAKLTLVAGIINVRHSKSTTELTKQNHSSSVILDAIMQIQDEVPTVVVSNISENSQSENLVLTGPDGTFCEIGPECPDARDVLWIPVDYSDPHGSYIEASQLRVTLLKLIREFSEAGYPGCEGCIDKKFQNLWNEGANRSAHNR
tara:strand:+ start:1591 stop:2112 length:522 start_codon:yes stop_codon:yes gene_type:complete